MSLLRDIQADATSPDADIPTLLRKCLVLAHRLKSDELRDWVTQELNGYKDRSRLPEYRKIRTESRGNFSGPFGKSASNMIIPSILLPDEWRDEMDNAYLMEPISSYSVILRRGNGARIEWPSELVVYMAEKIYDGMVCISAWKPLPINVIEAVIDTVKTRILSFTLTIENEAPDAGEALPTTRPLPEDRVSQIFHTVIMGGVQNLAAGGTAVSQTARVIQAPAEQIYRDLLDAVRSADAQPVEVAKMTAAIEELQESHGTESFGDKYLKAVAVLSDHVGVFGPIVGPALTALARLAT